MRKLIFTFFLLTLSICSFAYYDYWNGRLYSNGPYVNEMMAGMPYVKDSYASLSKQFVTDEEIDVSVRMQLGWYNYFRRLALNYYWADWIVVGFNYDRKVYYALKNSDSYKEMPEQRLTNQYLDVSNISKRASDQVQISNYSTQYNEYGFIEDLHINLSTLSTNNEYKLKIEYVFTPVPYSEHDGYHYNPDETVKYVRSQQVIVDKTTTGSQLLFRKAKVVSNSVINVNGSYNPYYNTGSGARYLVYDDPNAIISVLADTVNLPCTKSTIVGTTMQTMKGYGAFLSSVGASSVPTNIEPVTINTGCGVISNVCSRKCNSVTNNNIEFLNDNLRHKSFLSSKKYDTVSSCYRRWTNVMLRSLNENLTMYDENSVEDFSLFNRVDCRMSRIYHLRDFENVVTYSKEKYGTGAILKMQHSAIYTSSIDIQKQPKLKSYIALSYLYYGYSFDFDMAHGNDVVSNIMEFEVVSKVTVPKLSDKEKEEHLTCITDSLVREGDFIHLQGKQISCGVYSPSIYMPEYMWEVSFDGQRWEPVTSSNFSSYVINRYNIKFAIIMDESKDLLLRSTILKGKEKAMFRQKVVLKSFASNEISSLYNFDGNDGKYYISISGSDYYTYIPTPILDKENFAFSPLSFPEEQRLCKGDNLNNNKISFRLRNSTNVTTTQINKMSEIADYKIYELKDGVPSRIVSNSNSYIINWKGETSSYRCVISWCRDSLYRDVSVIANPDESMDVSMISSSAVICSRDKENKSISILCPQGTDPIVTMADTTKNEYDYFSRAVVEYTIPDTVNTDFKAMSRTKITSFMKSKGWDYEKETGTTIDNAGLDELRAWCKVKEHNENQKIVEEAKRESESLNSWFPFAESVSTVLKGATGEKSSVYYIKKRNKSTLCESDSLKVIVTYFEGLRNNVISFASASESSKSTTFVVKDSDSPAIKGLVISGGYGVPAAGNNNVYLYKYLCREFGGVWQPVGTDIVVTADEMKNVSLQKGAFKVDRKCEICRVAISRNGDDVITQVSDTSNILTIDIIEAISKDDVIVSGDGGCAGTKVSIGVTGFDPSADVKKRNIYVWETDDNSLMLIKSGEMDMFCDIYNSTRDFNVTIYREDTVLKVRTPEVVIPIKVSTVKPEFTLVTSTGNEEKILDYPDETFFFQSGTRFYLKNTSEGADSYVWNLELQYYTGQEIEGLKSYLESPVCYLYNQGQNKIRLTAKNALGCEASVTAENLYIQSSSLRRADIPSHFEDEQEFNVSTEALVFNVYPTIVGGEDVHIYYSGGGFKYLITNSIGEIIIEAEADSYVNVPFESQPQGLYQLCLWPLNGSDSEMQVYKILRK